MLKLCTYCNIEKQKTCFHKDSKSKSGIGSICKDCRKEKNKIYRDGNKEKIAILKKRWEKANPSKVKEAKNRWSKSNPDKLTLAVKAWQKVNPDKVRASQKKWREANLEKLRAYGKIYRDANPEKIKRKAREWLKENRDKANYKSKKWAKANPDKVKAASKIWREANKVRVADYKRDSEHARRAKKNAGGGRLSKGLFGKLFILQGGKCPVCKTALSNIKPRSPMDHVMPLALGGQNIDSNIQLLCRSCNSRKHAKHPVDFMQSQGFLI